MKRLGDAYAPGEDGIHEISRQVLDVLYTYRAAPQEARTMMELLSDTTGIFG